MSNALALLVDGVGSNAVGVVATAGAVMVAVAVAVVAGGFAAARIWGCDAVAFGDFLINAELLGMRFVDGGLALLAGICGGLSAPAGLVC